MYLFETEKGDRWICIHCGQEHKEMIEEKKWEFIFEKHDNTLRCSICKKGDYEFED